MPTLVRIDARDPAAGAAVELRAASHDLVDVCHAEGALWWPALSKLPTLRYDFFDGAFGGAITAPAATLTLRTEPWPEFGRYRLAGARVRLYVQDDAGAWPLRFDGRVTAEPKVADGAAEVAFAVDDSWLDTPLLATYAGTTGIEGPAELKGQVKPLALGAPRYVPGKLIDTVDMIFQLSAYGAVQGVEAVMERLARLGPSSGDYASLAALRAASIPNGGWATCHAQGLVRFGAPTDGQVSFHLRGDTNGVGGWVRKAGAIIGRLAERAGGGARVDRGSLAALDAARPYNLSLYLDQQTTARQLIQSIAASVNAVALVTWLGQLVVVPVAIGAPTIQLHADGAALPPVRSVAKVEIAPPFKKLAITAARTWSVHALADVAFTATLIDRGLYDPAEQYREGHIVGLADGSRWLFVGTEPATGVTPGTNAAPWELLQGRTVATDATGVSLESRLAAIRADLYAIEDAIETVTDAAAAIEGLADDGTLTIDEKIRSLVPANQRLDAAYTLLSGQTAGITYAAVVSARDTLGSAHDAWNSFLGQIGPKFWYDVTGPSDIDRATYRARLLAYENALTGMVQALRAYAQATGDAALTRVERVASDGWLSAGAEKAQVKQDYYALLDRLGGLVGRHDALGQPPEVNAARNAAGAAVYAGQSGSLGTYLAGLAPAWTDESIDTAIDPVIYRNRWQNALAKVDAFETALLGLVPASVQTSLNALLPLSDDGVWTPYEKRSTLIQSNAELEAQWSLLDGKAGQIAGSAGLDAARAAANSARAAWQSYLNSVPTWSDPNVSTTVNRAQARTLLVDYGAKLEALAEALRVYTDTRVSTLQSRLAVIEDDGVISKGEKWWYVREWQGLTNKYQRAVDRYIALGYPAAVTAKQQAAYAALGPDGNAPESSLGKTLGALTPDWTNGTVDTPLPDKAALQAKWISAENLVDQFVLAMTAQPDADNTATSATAVALGQKTQKLSSTGTLTSRRGTSVFSLGGAQQVVLLMDTGDGNGTPGSPLRASDAGNGTCNVEVRAHRVIDDAGPIDYNAFTFTNIQPNLDVWVYEDGNYDGGFRNYQITQVAAVLAGFPSPNPNRRLIGAIHTPASGQPAVEGTSGGGGGVRFPAYKYQQLENLE